MRNLTGTAQDIHLIFQGDGALLLDEPQQRLYKLNNMSTFVWCAYKEGWPTGEIARKLSQSYGISLGQAQTHTDAAIAQWRSLGLTGIQRATPSKQDRLENNGLPPAREADPLQYEYVADMRIQLGKSQYALKFSCSEIYDIAHSAFRHLAVSSQSIFTDPIYIIREASSVLVVRSSIVLEAVSSIEELVPAVVQLLMKESIRSSEAFLAIHAGVVVIEDGCLLLPGESGSGKTCLTAALVHRGFEYFSDEVALLGDQLDVSPFRVGLCVKSTGWDLLSGIFPEMATLPVHCRTFDQKRVRYLPPPTCHREREFERRLPVKWVVFPTHDADSCGKIEALGPTDGLMALLAECKAMLEPLDQSRLYRLLRQSLNVSFYTLKYPSSAAALEAIQDVCLGRGPRG